MAKLRWSLQAAEDLDEACQYIARDSEQYARLFATQVLELLRGKARQRLPGSMVPEYGRHEIRERLVYDYRVIVRVREQDQVLELVRIFHGARLLPTLE